MTVRPREALEAGVRAPREEDTPEAVILTAAEGSPTEVLLMEEGSPTEVLLMEEGFHMAAVFHAEAAPADDPLNV